MFKVVLPIIIIYFIYSVDGKNDEKNVEKDKNTSDQFSEQIGQNHSSQSNVAESSHNLASHSPQRRQNDEYSHLPHNIEEHPKKRPRELDEGQRQQNWSRLERIWSLERKRQKLEEELHRLIQGDPSNHQNHELENGEQQPESSNIMPIPTHELVKRAENLLDLDENDELPLGHEHLPPNNEQQNLPIFDRKRKGHLLDQSEIGDLANQSANVPPHHSTVSAQQNSSPRQKEQQQKILRTFLQHHEKLHEQQKIQSSILDQQIKEQVKLLALYQQQIQQIHRQQQPQQHLMKRGNGIEHQHQIHGPSSNSIAAEHNSSVGSSHSRSPATNSNVQQEQEPSSARQIGEKNFEFRFG